MNPMECEMCHENESTSSVEIRGTDITRHVCDICLDVICASLRRIEIPNTKEDNKHA